MLRSLPLTTRFALLATMLALAALALSTTAASAATSASLKDDFAVLRQAPTKIVPEEVTTFIEQTTKTVPLNATSTRRISAPGGGAWDIITGDDHVCLYVEDVDAGVCGSSAQTAEGRLSLITVPPPGPDGSGRWTQPADQLATIYGLAPDGVNRASAVTHDSRMISARVSAGLYLLNADSSVPNAKLITGTGQVLLAQGEPLAKGAKAQAQASKSGAGGPKARMASSTGQVGIPGGWAWYDSAGTFGPWAYLTGVAAMSSDSICVNAQNTNGTWAGLAACSTGLLVSHVYDKSYVRRGVVCANGGGNWAYGQGHETYWVP